MINGTPGVTGLHRIDSVAISADGAHVYALGRQHPVNPSIILAGSVAVFGRDAGTGHLTLLDVTYDGIDGVAQLLTPTALSLSPDDGHLYVTANAMGSGPTNAVVVLARDAGSGFLSFVQRRRSHLSQRGLDRPTGLAVTADGAHLYAVHPLTDSVTTIALDGGTGAPTVQDVVFDGEVDGLLGAVAVVASQDGRHVYVASEEDDAIVTFARDTTTGALTAIDTLRGVPGLDRPTAMTLSPDDASLHLATSDGASLLSFARDPSTGLLTLIDAEQDGVGGIEGMASVRALVVSPDGAHLYAVGPGTRRLSIFGRAPNGTLSLVAAPSVPELEGPLGIALSPDGAFAYMAALDADAIVVYARDASSGLLTLVEVANGGPKLTRLVSPRAVGMRAGATHLHALTSAGTLHTFLRDATSGRLTFVGVTRLPASTGSVLAEAPSGLAYTSMNGIATIGAGFAGCDPAPVAPCLPLDSAGRSTLTVKRTTPTKSLLTWVWSGAPTVSADFGAPNTGDGVALCLYDESTGSSLVVRALAHGDDRWAGLASNRGWKFLDTTGSPEGLRSVQLTTTSPGRATLTVKGKGTRLGLPALPLGLPLRTQLQSAAGACWEAIYSTTGTRRNDTKTYKGRAD